MYDGIKVEGHTEPSIDTRIHNTIILTFTLEANYLISQDRFAFGKTKTFLNAYRALLQIST
jgi:hypothetical protein